jgi:hypothetical protein
MAAVFAIVFQALSFFNGAAVPSPDHGGTCAPAEAGIYGAISN